MKKVIFIDRDGVINKDPGGWTEYSYVTKCEDFVFIPDSLTALKRLNDAGFGIVVISNQGGVSKGYFTEKDLNGINKKMMEEIEKKNIKLKRVYYCIHQESDNCDCKKPKTGLFNKAEKELGVIARGKYFIGDGKMDVEAGKKIGMKTILLLSGKTSMEDVKAWDVKPDFICRDLSEAVDMVLGKHAENKKLKISAYTTQKYNSWRIRRSAMREGGKYQKYKPKT